MKKVELFIQNFFRDKRKKFSFLGFIGFAKVFAKVSVFYQHFCREKKAIGFAKVSVFDHFSS